MGMNASATASSGFVDPVSILHKSTAGRYRPVRVADGPITAPVDLCRMLAGDFLIKCHVYKAIFICKSRVCNASK